jgi:Gpi18-like mannosyltransferase
MSRQDVRAALLAFLSSRVLFFSLVIVGAQISFLHKVYSGSVWETKIVLQQARLRPELVRSAMIGDAWWYRSVSVNGYDLPSTTGRTMANWAFFPLYPVVVRMAPITGEFALDGMIVSNAAFLGALLLATVVARGFGATDGDAERVVVYLAFFPTSYFCSLPMSESLFLLLSLAAFAGALHERWLLAGLFGGLAALTRVPGILLLPALLLLAWERRPRSWAPLLWLGLIPAADAAFMIYLRQRTGDPLAFLHAQTNWGRAVGAFWQPLLRYLTNWQTMGEPWNLLALNFVIAILLGVAGVALLWRRHWSLGFYALASVLLPLSDGSLQSVARYAVVVFPLFLWLSTLGRHPLADRMMTAISVTLFGCLIALFVLRVDFALS